MNNHGDYGHTCAVSTALVEKWSESHNLSRDMSFADYVSPSPSKALVGQPQKVWQKRDIHCCYLDAVF